jgi:acyl-coenzyme A thioesterase PaaI-like protein
VTRNGEADPPGEPSWGELLRRGREEVPPRRAELRRLAAAARLLSDKMVSNTDDEATIKAAADAVEEAVALLSGGGRSSYEGFAEALETGDDPAAFFDYSPLLGLSNPGAPPLEIEFVDGRVHGRAVFGAAYEGPPGCVHGGWIAAAFDELLGSAQSTVERPGMTGTLKVVYRSPSPLFTELTFEGGVERLERRKIFVQGTVSVGDRLCAEAEGIFVSINRDKFEALRSTDDVRADPFP